MGTVRQKKSAANTLAALKSIRATRPDGTPIYIILDNLSAHMGPGVTRWLDHPKRARWHLHFTPTSSSWLNLVERWFALLSQRQIKRGSHRSTVQLEKAVRDFLAIHNEDPKPFVWHKTADQIIESVGRFCTRINDSVH